LTAQRLFNPVFEIFPARNQFLIVDLHRNLSQNRPFLASQTDPPAPPNPRERLVFALLDTVHFQAAKVGSL
jgi:hypothetical protein